MCVQSKLGDHMNLANLVTQILTDTDGNRDGRVSLPEARSTWALLQMDEVSDMFVLFKNKIWSLCF